MRISDWSSDVCSSDLAGLAAGPLQDRLARSAQALDARWQQWFDQPLELPEARELVNDTRTFLADVPVQTQQTQSRLMEIVMAQDFLDLTGLVIMRMMDVVGAIERELLQGLLDNVQKASCDER